MLIDLVESNFEDRVMSSGIALIDCWAPWCAACKDYTPTFEAAAERHAAHTFAKLNTHDQSELAKKLKVSHIPTTILFRDGLLLLRQPGYLNAEEIDQAISTAEGLDMAQVRADMEKRKTGEST
jgi:thioredoxin-like negative regulator of GroEL